MLWPAHILVIFVLSFVKNIDSGIPWAVFLLYSGVAGTVKCGLPIIMDVT